VEVLVPIRDAAHRAKIDGILEAYLSDSTAWVLGVDGEYAQRPTAGTSAQESFAGSI